MFALNKSVYDGEKNYPKIYFLHPIQPDAYFIIFNKCLGKKIFTFTLVTRNGCSIFCAYNRSRIENWQSVPCVFAKPPKAKNNTYISVRCYTMDYP